MGFNSAFKGLKTIFRLNIKECI